MATEFLCACGETLIASDEDGVPVACRQCGKIFAPKISEEFQITPISQSIMARAAAWGCLFPIACVLLVFACKWLLAKQSMSALSALGGGVALATAWIWLLRQNRYRPRTLTIVGGVVGVGLALFTWSTWKRQQHQAELDGRFARLLALAWAEEKAPGKATQLRGKCLPVVLTPRGETHRGTTPHVLASFYAALPDRIRAYRAEDVHSLIVLDWWYEQSGTYVTKDELRTIVSNIYRGGCTLNVVDVDTGKIVHTFTFARNPEAPQERPGEDMTSWYGQQPTEEGILDYVNKFLEFTGPP
ncbi:MAG TPA: hypothetical protein VGP72_30015 [Planctomycetota bacterium]|jgi:hypothetical protein